MIISTLKDSARVERLHPALKELFDYVKTHDLLNMEPGRIVINDKWLFINNLDTVGEPPSMRPLEVHRSYIDVHILLEGKERIGWLAPESLKKVVQEYNPEQDMALYTDEPSLYVDLLPGQFAIVFPEDPHAPMIGEGKIRKLIAKIKI